MKTIEVMSQKYQEALQEVLDYVEDNNKNDENRFVAEAASELHQLLLLVRDCEHVCTGNCRRVGCNCLCGEWHEEIKEIPQFKGTLESLEKIQVVK